MIGLKIREVIFLPSKATQKGLLSEKLSRSLTTATDNDRKKRHRAVSDPDDKLLLVLFDVCVKDFEGDEEQATCALRRHLVLRYQWSNDKIDQRLDDAGVLRTVSAVAQ